MSVFLTAKFKIHNLSRRKRGIFDRALEEHTRAYAELLAWASVAPPSAFSSLGDRAFISCTSLETRRRRMTTRFVTISPLDISSGIGRMAVEGVGADMVSAISIQAA